VPTNADVREIGTAIRADRRRLGEFGEAIRVVNAVDRTDEIYEPRSRSVNRCTPSTARTLRSRTIPKL